MIPHLTRVLALVLCILSLPVAPAQAQSQRAQTLTTALDAVRDSDWDRALDLARALPDQQARDVVIWHWLRAPQGSFDDYLNFLSRNGD